MTNSQTFSIVALAIAGITGAVITLVWGPNDQRVTVATLILASTPATIASLIAAFKASAAKAVAEELHIQVNSRLTALIEANERAFQAEKEVAHAAGVVEGKSGLSTKPLYTNIPLDHPSADKPTNDKP